MLAIGHDWNEKTEAIAAATAGQVIQHSDLMPQFAVALWTFVMAGVNNGVEGTGVEKYRMLLGTAEILNVLAAELRSLLELLYSRFGGAAPATTDLTYPVPFHLLGILFSDLTDAEGIPPEVGLPSNTDKVWQMITTVNSSLGTSTIGWLKSYREPTHVPYLIGHAVTGLTASVNNQPYILPWQALQTAGFILDFGATEFTRLRLYIPDDNKNPVELFDLTRDQALALQQPYSANSITDPFCLIFGRTVVPVKGSYLLIDAGAGINGTQRFVPIQVMQRGGGIPAAA